MLYVDHIKNVLAALVLCSTVDDGSATGRFDPNPNWQNADTMYSLVEILESWLDLNAGIKRRPHPPKIEVIHWTMSIAKTGIAGRNQGLTRGLYDPETSTVYLIEPWDRTNATDVSVLLHELVHHRQAPLHFYCAGAQEEAAYRLQDEWLEESGLHADVNWIEVVLEAGCTPRDFHPD